MALPILPQAASVSCFLACERERERERESLHARMRLRGVGAHRAPARRPRGRQHVAPAPLPEKVGCTRACVHIPVYPCIRASNICPRMLQELGSNVLGFGFCVLGTPKQITRTCPHLMHDNQADREALPSRPSESESGSGFPQDPWKPAVSLLRSRLAGQITRLEEDLPLRARSATEVPPKRVGFMRKRRRTSRFHACTA